MSHEDCIIQESAGFVYLFAKLQGELRASEGFRTRQEAGTRTDLHGLLRKFCRRSTTGRGVGMWRFD